MKLMGEFMNDLDSQAAHYYLINEFNHQSRREDYVRAQVQCDIHEQSLSEGALDKLKEIGNKLWSDRKEAITQLVRLIIFDKYADDK